MELNLKLMKLVTRLVVLMIFFVIIYLISAVLYSARYWPDVYNYINANITIKRIPTISDLKLTVYEVEYTTELYMSTTDGIEYVDVTTEEDLGIGFDDFNDIFDDLDSGRRKRQVVVEEIKDYRELPIKHVVVDYLFGSVTESTISELTTDVNIYSTNPLEDMTPLAKENTESTYVKITEEIVDSKYKATFVEDLLRNFFESKSSKLIQAKEGTNDDDYSKVLNEKPLESENEIDNETLPGESEEIEDNTGTVVMKDLVDESKLTTRNNADVELVTRVYSGDNTDMSQLNSDISSVYSWIATIFIANDTTNNQFEYVCDGAILADNTVLTAARCLHFANSTVNVDNVLVILGRKSLQSSSDNEKVLKVKEIRLHDNFTLSDTGKVENDLAVIILEQPVIFNNHIQPARLTGESLDGDTDITTAWNVTGALVPIFFLKQKKGLCGTEIRSENTFCATYGDAVALCPSYGGLYVIKFSNNWYLQGILTGDPTYRGLCFKKTLMYTSLTNYSEWIFKNVDNKM